MMKTKSQIRAAQIAELQAQQDAYDRSVREAMKSSAFARCDAVEQLYELLDIAPERPVARAGKNGPYEVAQDKDETKRAARLVEAVGVLAELAGKRSSDGARPMQHHPKAASEQGSASAAADHYESNSSM